MFGNDTYCPDCSCPTCRTTRSERAKWKTDESGALYREYGFGSGPMVFSDGELRAATSREMTESTLKEWETCFEQPPTEETP